ncbi:hypothetical protein KIN20_000641 [Parelaphostrongylus tenuis]|uniref:Uncharacterized protein n=1 Tax=Parelaphostrongylus tenuis TaxID=148309 RepID=A0AAD5QG75_PARTN|nr:hypothetical protein KIN20_000641 [Parelaphostrongylus tenuis]
MNVYSVGNDSKLEVGCSNICVFIQMIDPMHVISAPNGLHRKVTLTNTNEFTLERSHSCVSFAVVHFASGHNNSGMKLHIRIRQPLRTSLPCSPPNKLHRRRSSRRRSMIKNKRMCSVMSSRSQIHAQNRASHHAQRLLSSLVY